MHGLDGATTGTLTIPAGDGEDVYLDASQLTATISSATGGNFENLVVGTGSATAFVNDTINTNGATATILVDQTSGTSTVFTPAASGTVSITRWPAQSGSPT